MFWGCGASGELASLLEPEVTVLTARTQDEALELLGRPSVAVLCLGEQIPSELAHRFLSRVLATRPSRDLYTVVLAAGSEPELFQDFIDDDQLYYLTQSPPSSHAVREIVKSAVARHLAVAAQRAEPETDDDDWAEFAQGVLDLVGHLALEMSTDRVPTLTAQAVEQLFDSDRARCLVYDPVSETLRTGKPGDSEERRESAAAGLVSYVARTGAVVSLDRVGEDPRYDSEADTDRGAPDERFLAAPVATVAPAGDEVAGGRAPAGVWAVVVALRDGSRPPFLRRERDRLVFLAQQLAPLFNRWALQARLDELADKHHGAAGGQTEEIFRREALEHRLRGFGDHGEVLQISPRWTRWAYRLLLAVFATAVLYMVTGSIDEYVAGPAVVRLEGRNEITATLPGTVTSVAVEAGQRVAAGQLLARFDSVQEAAELDRIELELELGLIRRLRDPADVDAGRALSSLRAQKQLAAARLEARSARAPEPGVVSDLRIRPGQHLSAGQVILSLLGESNEFSIIVMFPGHYRPQIEPGMPLRLELRGYRYAYQHLIIDRVGNEVLGPAEARRFLGTGIGDAVALNGPLVLAYARLPAAIFESDGRTFEYRDGIQGTAELRLGAAGILPSLVPALKALFRSSHG